MGKRMDDELQKLREKGYRSAVVGPKPFSSDEILRNVDPAPDEEAEAFVAAIYADRRKSEEPSAE
jgi:acyl-homoserine lactone acylase PvdQ